MCQFNFILTKKSATQDSIEPILTEAGFRYTEIENEHVRNQIQDFEKLVLTTKGHCDFGSILGIDQYPSSQQIDVGNQRRKLNKKKWSDAKIERHLENKLKSQTRKEENRELGNRNEEDRWLKVIQELINQNIDFYLFHHQFSGALYDEQIEFSTREKIQISELSIKELRNLKDSELIRIAK